MADIQKLINLSLKGNNKWRDVLTGLLSKPSFPSMIYQSFFVLSPNSKKKFTNMTKQSTVLGGALKILLSSDNSNLERSSDTRRLVRRMKRAHTKHHISELEFNHFKMAISLTTMFFLHFDDKKDEFVEFQRGFVARMNNIKSLVVAKSIKLSSSTLDEDD